MNRLSSVRIASHDSPSGDDDAVLLRRVAEGDREALERLYRCYQPRLCRFLSRFTSREDLAEEVINDCFWLVWQRAGDFRGECRVSTWLMGVAYRMTLKALRDRRDDRMACLEESSHPAFELDAQRELADWVDKGLARLPEEQRMTLELAYGQGHSLDEIAEIMDCSLSAVKSRMFHARTKLRHLMPELAGDPRPLA